MKKLLFLSMFVIVCVFAFLACDSNAEFDFTPDCDSNTESDYAPDCDSNTESDYAPDCDINLENDYTLNYSIVISLGYGGTLEEYKTLLKSGENYILPSQNGFVHHYDNNALPDYIYSANMNTTLDIFRAIPADGFYFEKWEGYTASGESFDMRREWEDVYYYDNICSLSPGDFRLIRAVFTNDFSKLQSYEFNYDIQVNAVSPDAGITLSEIPDKIVSGTRILQTIQANEGDMILESSYLIPAKPSLGYHYDSVLNPVRYVQEFNVLTRWVNAGQNSEYILSFDYATKWELLVAKKADYFLVGVWYNLKTYCLDVQSGELTFVDYTSEPVPGSVLFSALPRTTGISIEVSMQHIFDFVGWYTLDSEFLSDDRFYQDSNFVGDLFMLQARVDQTKHSQVEQMKNRLKLFL